MSPYFNKGDIVGGQKIINEQQFSLLDGQICIIEATNGAQYLRRVIKSDQRKIICCALNADNGAPPIQEIEALSIAQVTRRWLLSSLVRNLHVGELLEKVAYPPLEGAKRKKPSRKKPRSLELFFASKKFKARISARYVGTYKILKN